MLFHHVEYIPWLRSHSPTTQNCKVMTPPQVTIPGSHCEGCSPHRPERGKEVSFSIYVGNNGTVSLPGMTKSASSCISTPSWCPIIMTPRAEGMVPKQHKAGTQASSERSSRPSATPSCNSSGLQCVPLIPVIPSYTYHKYDLHTPQDVPKKSILPGPHYAGWECGH